MTEIMPELDVMVNKLADLTAFMAYLESTNDDEWQTDTVRNSDNSKNCVMGHLINWFYDEDQVNISYAWDIFEEMWATTYMIYPVNDGESPSWMNHRYDQPTPKQRVIAYLKNLQLGKEKTTNELMDWEAERQLA